MSESARKNYGRRPPAESFTWWWTGKDGQETSGDFTAKRALTFGEQLDYDAAKAALAAETIVTAKGLLRDMKAIDAKADADGSDPETSLKEMDGWLDSRKVNDHRLWEQIVEGVLMLISDTDQDRLRPVLLQASAADVRALRDDLETKLGLRTEAEVAAVARVDPTSPPSPDDSLETPDSGPTSG